ncbi:unnamed protein product [Polarella glacialis]|uniref:Beta-lactamase-related domain-containing protein n=1 Tax=Polarella glacialis TaxID=89957 RepID=A0A813HPJ8_POLGL|nr:unnamed protein product [Polarella glacialis]
MFARHGFLASLLPLVALARFERLERHLNVSSYGNYMYQNIALTLGTPEGDVFQYANGKMTVQKKLVLGSGSKWPAATALLAMIAHAEADLDAPMSKHLSWWTTDPKDPRSKATLRHFLTMTSGMVTDGTDSKTDFSDGELRQNYSKTASIVGFATCFGTNTQCVRKLYEASPALYAPGEYFMYGTLTFNYVAAAMEAVLHRPIDLLLQEHFLQPMGMKTAFWLPPIKPLLGAGLTASAEDMGKFLQRMLRKDFLPRWLHDEQENITLRFEQYSTQNAGFGPYGMGLWGECIDGCWTQAWPQECQAAKRFSHPGCYGYWNYISRRDGYYFNFFPSYTCDKSNGWCGTGQKPQALESCPALNAATQVRLLLDTFVEDAMRSPSSAISAAAPRPRPPPPLAALDSRGAGSPLEQLLV